MLSVTQSKPQPTPQGRQSHTRAVDPEQLSPEVRELLHMLRVIERDA